MHSDPFGDVEKNMLKRMDATIGFWFIMVDLADVPQKR